MLFRHPFLDGEGDASGGGAPPPTIKVQHGGAEIEVPRPEGYFTQAEVNQKYVPKATHDAQMGTMRKQLSDRQSWKNPDDLLNDESFKTRAMETWGLNPNATQKQFQETLDKTRREIDAQHITPLKTKLTDAEKKIERLRDKDLTGQIVQALSQVPGFNKDLLKSPVKGKPPMAVSMLRDAFGYNEEHDAFFARSGDSFQYSQTGDAPYMTVSEFVASWVAGDGKSFVASERQGGAESGVSGIGASGAPATAGQVGKELRLTPEQIRDIPFFKKMQEKALKEGLTIVPIAAA